MNGPSTPGVAVLRGTAYFLALAFVLARPGTPAARGGEDVFAVRDGEAVAAIWPGDNPAPAEKYAAEELQRALRLMTGAELPIVNAAPAGPALIIGTPESHPRVAAARERLSFRDGAIDELRILGDFGGEGGGGGGVLIFAGAAPRGALYAVYAWLESLGARWLWPGDDGEFLPALKDIRLDALDVRESAAFPYRGYHLCGMHEDEDSEIWMARNRMNILRSRPDAREYLPRRVAKGFHIMFSSHNAGLDAKSLAENPEYAALVGGRREADRGGDAQICWSNPGARELIASRLAKDWDNFPELEIMQLFPPDNTRFCQCEPCREMGTVPTQWHWVLTDLIARIEKTHPGKRYSTIAYSSYIAPPEGGIAPVEFIEFCLYGRCYRHLREDDCPRNGKAFEQLEAWRARDVPLAVYGYEFDNFAGSLFTPFRRLMPDQMKWYRDLGMLGFITEINPHGWPADRDPADRMWDNNRLAAYLGARHSWNPDADPGKVPADYYAAAYGPAAEAVRELDGLWEDAWHGAPEHPGYFFNQPARYVGGFVDAALLKKTAELVARARAALNEDKDKSGAGARGLKSLEIHAGALDRWRTVFELSHAVDGRFAESGGGPNSVLLFQNGSASNLLPVELVKRGYRVSRVAADTDVFLEELAAGPEVVHIWLSSGKPLQDNLDAARVAGPLRKFLEKGGMIVYSGYGNPPEEWELGMSWNGWKVAAGRRADFVAEGDWADTPNQLRRIIERGHTPSSGQRPQADSGWTVLATQPTGNDDPSAPFLLRRRRGAGTEIYTTSDFSYGGGGEMFGDGNPNRAAELIDNFLADHRLGMDR